ncbi:hypothetical protein J4E93_003647 [Alternaria ventricosa]|uniref:uncharacterized protein n=1 Tax=Alternaria ventricosa TaxID=1187951 RepID=UPI0020C5356D|nr:uncharacterized protein J4E93_003647 [Alternaria ventricosa]KAI4649331.1 hypothetical protein J4E93_003647 [Alternaria ventricosa]
MTAVTTTLVEDDRSVANTSSLVHVEPTAENADLYTMDLPEYTQQVAGGEISVDAESTQNEKQRNQDQSPAYDPLPSSEPRSLQEQHEFDIQQDDSEQGNPSHRHSSDPPALTHDSTEADATASLASVRACSILHDRPAVWLVKRKSLALSPLAAAVLTKEGLLQPKDLHLISQYSDMKHDPTDPVSAAFLTTYDVVSGIMLGLIAGPIELGKQTTPMLLQREIRRKEKRDGTATPSPPLDTKDSPHVARQVALGTAKGFGRIITTSLKSPAIVMHGITRGFHNLPKAYGEEVRQYENVTGLRSGLLVSFKSFGYGLSDGIRDLIIKPIDGAEKNGVLGFAAGCATGVMNAAFKPAAGACGLVGYSSVGVYKSIRNIGSVKKEDPIHMVQRLGEIEYQQASDADRLYVVRLWCQTQMRVRIG